MTIPGNIKITDLKSKGKYISVKQIGNTIHVIFLPEEQDKEDTTSIFLFNITELLYIEEMTEIILPKFTNIHIGKIYNDTKGDFVIQGNIILDKPNPSQFKNTDFRVKNYTNIDYRESHKSSVGVVYNISIDDIVITAISRKKEIVHVIGYRITTTDEVYIQYNANTNTIVHEVAFYSGLGDITLEEVYCNENEEVLLVGFIRFQDENFGFFSKMILNTFTPAQDH